VKVLSKPEVAHLVDAIKDALLEIEEVTRCDFYSQGVVDKLTSSLEILEREELE